MGGLCSDGGSDAVMLDENIKDSSGDIKTVNDTYVKKKYEMGKTLGKGGSCRVVQVENKLEKTKFALKIMSKKEKMNKDLFLKERDVLRMLKHPNIICITESFQDTDHYYIVSNLLTGGELFDRIVDKTQVMTEQKAARWVETMLRAISECHKNDIVHRDLKPENFVFQDKSEESDLVLIDFGCAMTVEKDKVYKDLVGTPYYLAPESAAGHKYIRTGAILKSSDIWSIGIIAYVLMTGRPPFNGVSNTEIFTNIIKKPLKFPPGIKLSKSFLDFVKKMLKKSPKYRLDVDKALAHPWVQGVDASDKAVSKDVLRVLKQFNQQSKLKKAITKTLASHMGKEPKEKIRQHFNRLDKDGSGALDAQELGILLMDMGISEDQAIKEARQIIATTDMDKSGEIEFEEFAQIWQRKLLTVNESYIHAVFGVLDENKDGKISVDELKKVLEEEDAQKVKDMIAEVDLDGDECIDFEEFKKAMMESSDDKKPAFGNVGHELNEADLNSADIGDVNLDMMNTA